MKTEQWKSNSLPLIGSRLTCYSTVVSSSLPSRSKHQGSGYSCGCASAPSRRIVTTCALEQPQLQNNLKRICFYLKVVRLIEKIQSVGLSLRSPYQLTFRIFARSLKISLTVYEDMIDYCSYVHNLSSCEIKAWKKFRLEQDSNPWSLQYRCSTQPTTNQQGVGHFVSLQYTRRW